MKNLKLLAFATIVTLSQQLHAAEVFCWGDSINNGPYEMCDLLEREYGHNVHNYSQGGRSFLSSQLPPDLAMSGDWWPRTALMMMGTNDMYAGLFFGKSRAKFTSQADTLLNHGYRLVIVVPPTFVGYEEKIAPVQQMMTEYCATPKTVNGETVQALCMYADDVWVDPADHIHPDRWLSAILANWLDPVL